MGLFDPSEWNDLLEQYEQTNEDAFLMIKSTYNWVIFSRGDGDATIYWKVKQAYLHDLSIYDERSHLETKLDILGYDHPNFCKKKNLNGTHILFADANIYATYESNSKKIFNPMGLELIDKPFVEFGDRFQPIVKISNHDVFQRNTWLMLAGDGLGKIAISWYEPKHSKIIKEIPNILCLHPSYWDGYYGVFSKEKGVDVFKKHLWWPAKNNKQKGLLLIPLQFLYNSATTNSDKSPEDVLENLELASDAIDIAGIFF